MFCMLSPNDGCPVVGGGRGLLGHSPRQGSPLATWPLISLGKEVVSLMQSLDPESFTVNMSLCGSI